MVKNNQKGFAAFEAVLIVVALVAIGAAGYFAYQARQDKTDYSVSVAKKSQTATNSTTSPVAQKDEKTQITEALTSFCSTHSDFGGNSKVSYSSVTKREGQFVAVGATCNSDDTGGFSAYLKKGSNSMTVVYGGQQLPGKAEGEKLGLPSSWYSTDY